STSSSPSLTLPPPRPTLFPYTTLFRSLSVPRTVSKRRGSGLWPAHCHGDLALKSGHHQLAAARGNGEKRGSALAMAAPDPFDKRRVGWSVLVKDNHFTLP